MAFTIIDFLIGFTLMNAMPHFIFSISKVRFLSPFGYSSSANLYYSITNFAIALVLFQIKYGLSTIANNGIFLGALVILAIYFITGRFLFNIFQKR